MAAKGVVFVEVRTLAGNLSALKTCFTRNFRISSTDLHFHRWIRRPMTSAKVANPRPPNVAMVHSEELIGDGQTRGQIVQRALPRDQRRSGDDNELNGEEFAFRGLIPDAHRPPLNGRARPSSPALFACHTPVDGDCSERSWFTDLSGNRPHPIAPSAAGSSCLSV